MTTTTRIEARLDALEKNAEKGDRSIADVREQVAENGRKIDQLQSLIEQLIVANRQGIQTSSSANGEGGGVGDGGLGRSFISTKKVELPSFNGDDPLSWLAKAEQYFAIQHSAEAMKVRWALSCMEGPALHWSRWLQQRRPSLTWEELKGELVQRFASQIAVNPYEAMAAVKQWDSVSSYIDEFIARSSCVADLAESHYIGCFLNGLREEIRIHIRSHEITDIYRTMNLAREIERELEVVGDWGKGGEGEKGRSLFGSHFGLGSQPLSAPHQRSGSSSNGPRASVAVSTPASVSHADLSKGESMSAKVTSGVKSNPSATFFDGSSSQSSTSLSAASGDLSEVQPTSGSTVKTARPSTYQEYTDLRAKGLCFKCKQPYSPTHQCPNRGLRTLILAEDEEFKPEHFDPGGTFEGEKLGGEIVSLKLRRF